MRIKAERIQGVTLSPACASGWTRESGQANYNMYGFYPHFLQPWVPEGALVVKSTCADAIHVIGVQKTVNPDFRGMPNCLSLALVKSLSLNERVTDITTIGLVLVWCPVLPGAHHFGVYKLLMLLLLFLVQNMAFVPDCNMVRCNWWTEQFLPCHEVLDIAT